MGIGRSTFYDTPDARARDLTIVAEMKTICDEFEAYGYRRVDAELRHRGIVVNAKKIRRLMREHALNPRQRRRFIATTDSDHNYPIFPNLAKNMKLDGPNQLWVADITSNTPQRSRRQDHLSAPRLEPDHPVVKSFAPLAERVLLALVRAGNIAVERGRDVRPYLAHIPDGSLLAL